MTRCIIGFGFNSKGTIRSIRCGKWSCPECAKHNAKMWAWRAKLQINEDEHEYYFWTLTLGRKYTDPAKAFAALPRLWDGIRKAVERHYRKTTSDKRWKWTYLAFVEGQPNRRGMPHFHIISRVKSPYRIKDFAVHHGFGHQAMQPEIVGTKAAVYVSKYASKGDPTMPKGYRRVRASRDWHKLPPFEGDRLYTPKKTENLTGFFVRVHNATGADLEEIASAWFLAIASQRDDET